MATEKLYDKWAARNPQWETKYEDLIKTYCDYGKGETSLREARGKLFGAGYELYIVAFFIGLYANQRRPLIEDTTKRKEFGWAIENWGNIEKRLGRTPYPKIRDYMFAALIARSDIDFIALDKGDLSLRKAVDILIQTMEEYANWGFHFMEDKLTDDPNYFFHETAFLEVFLAFDATSEESIDKEEPESLD